MSDNATLPDSQQLSAETFGAAPFPGRPDGMRVFFDQFVHDAIHEHASEDTSVEICGVLVGSWKQDEGGPYVHVSASIRGEAATSKFAEVTFTHESWSKINARMDKDFLDRSIVGWYHTHPDFGIFLSERDVFIHQHFFSAPGQIAFVVDPLRHEEGVFIWKGGKPTLTPAHWVGSGLAWAPRTTSRDGGHQNQVSTVAPSSDRPVPRSPETPRPNSILLLLAAFGLFVSGYLIARNGERQQQILMTQALAQQLYIGTSSPEASRAMQEVRVLLSEIADENRKLTDPMKEGVEPPKPERVSAAINTRVTRANAEIDRSIAAMALRPEQQAAIDLLVAQRLKIAVEQSIQELLARGVITLEKSSVAPALPTNPPAGTPREGK